MIGLRFEDGLRLAATERDYPPPLSEVLEFLSQAVDNSVPTKYHKDPVDPVQRKL